MESILYNAMNGAKINLDRQTITANNLANAATTGFKEDIFQAQSLYLIGETDTGAALAVENPPGTDLTAGTLITTGRDLDVAIAQGNGWFAVQDSSGKEAYTRSGSLQINANGMLLTASGSPVIGEGGPISIPPAKSIAIGSDGTISIVPLGNGPAESAVLDRLKLVSLDEKQAVKDLDGLMKLKKGGVAEADPAVTVVQGALENSNVNSVEQMINMIAAGREFESEVKLMQMADDNAERLAHILQA